MPQKNTKPSLLIISAVIIGLSLSVIGQWMSTLDIAKTEQLTAQVISPQGNVCDAETVAAAVVLDLKTFKPKRFTSRQDGGRYQLRGTPGEVFRGDANFEANLFATYEREFLLEVFDDGCSNCIMVLDGQTVGTINGKTDFTSEPRGGVLIDKVEGQFSSRHAQYVLFELEEKSITLSPQQLKDGDQVVEMGDLIDLLGADYVGQTDPPTLQEVTVRVTGDAKASIGDVDQNVFTVNEQNMDQKVFVCKDSLGNNGVCDFQECTVPVSKACSDGLDNDGDGKIDFPGDPGCNSSDDEDETDPPTGRAVSLSNTGSSTGTTTENLYPLGVQANFPNNLFVKARVGNRFEMVRMTPVILPSSASNQPSNASLHFYLLRGTDSEGKEHISVMQGRFWDPTTFADTSRTSDPWFSFFASGGDLSTCVAQMGSMFSAVPFYLDNPFFFQQMLEMLSLCQRGPSGATPNAAPTSGAVLLGSGPSSLPVTTGGTTVTASNPALTPVTTSPTGTISIPFSGTTSPTGIVPGSLSSTAAGTAVVGSPTTGTPKTLVAVFSMSNGGNQFLYQDFTSVQNFTLPTTACLEYDLMTPTADTRISFDLTFSDGSNLRDSGAIDLNGALSHPSADLSNYTLNQFYERIIPLTSHAGKTIVNYDIAAEYDNPGSQTAQFRDIQITDCSGTTLQVIYDGNSFTDAVHLTNASSNTVSFITN